MENFINKEFSLAPSPVSSEEWKNKTEKDRITMVYEQIKLNSLYEGFEVVSADDNAHITLKIERSIPSNERGVLLLDLESSLKTSIEKAITIWLEPVGDKSKLRNLRGITFKKDEEN